MLLHPVQLTTSLSLPHLRCWFAATLQPVIASLDPNRCSPGLSAIIQSAWPLLLHTMSSDAPQLTPAAVLSACQAAVTAMNRVVAQPGAANSLSAAGNELPPEEEVIAAFAARQERFRSRVLDAAIQEEVDQVCMWGVTPVTSVT
jgi:hypothetical protein